MRRRPVSSNGPLTGYVDSGVGGAVSVPGFCWNQPGIGDCVSGRSTGLGVGLSVAADPSGASEDGGAVALCTYVTLEDGDGLPPASNPNSDRRENDASPDDEAVDGDDSDPSVVGPGDPSFSTVGPGD